MHLAEDSSNKTKFLPPLCKELSNVMPSAVAPSESTMPLQYSHISCVGTYSNSESYLLSGFDKSELMDSMTFFLIIASFKEINPLSSTRIN